ncbi:RNA polymerase sigma factor [Syntrophotalea carbinolica DSM 2380]|uniref:RNA polymerase sigma factor n=1 Tax=Syntrophotalea carbinolica (strain DSM 2380 / NBRC 103641 / GraBd1) TaxID=338963 RepID=Q39ZU8_SYNC1|nr:RNA polymerase sigma factor [Syntrophotalea carbinolica]ABA90359.1 RNA polymerase sigma factor [Syntrophotalea carbinolica DSM 2380]
MDYRNTAAVIEVDEVPEQLSEPMTDSESLLLERIRQGDEGAFTQLVSGHLSSVVNLAYRMLGDRQEAEDLAQEAFLRLHRSLPSFRGDCRIKTWLYKVVSRLVIDHIRREQVRRRIFFFRKHEDDPDPVANFADPSASPSDQLLGQETRQKLFKAMEKLSGRQRAVFVLRHQEGLPLKEIAQVLHLKEGTVKAHLHRAVQCIRQEFTDQEEVTS